MDYYALHEKVHLHFFTYLHKVLIKTAGKMHKIFTVVCVNVQRYDNFSFLSNLIKYCLNVTVIFPTICKGSKKIQSKTISFHIFFIRTYKDVNFYINLSFQLICKALRGRNFYNICLYSKIWSNLCIYFTHIYS